MKRYFVILFLFLILVISCQTSYESEVSLMNNTDGGISVLGPISINFAKPIMDGSIEKTITITPPQSVKYQWQGNQLNIFPETFFIPNQEYQISLGKSVSSQNKNQIQSEYFWKVKTHPECLIFIGSATESPEIWKVCLNDNSRSQLSRSQGKIVDFNVSDDGNWIVYSIRNDLEGTDIWLMDRNGKENRIFYKCNEDSCHEPRFSTDGRSVIFIYSAKNNGIQANDKNDDIFIINIKSGEKYKLPINKKIKATFLQWSADQKYISFFDSFSSSFWIWNLGTNQNIELPSDEGLGGFWKRNQNVFVFANFNYWGGLPFGQLNQWEEETNSIHHIFGDENDSNEYFAPLWNPQSDWIALAYRPMQGSASKQIVLFSVDWKQRKIVTNNQTFSYSSYSWSYDGEMIAFQRYQIGLSGTVPEIGLWRMSDQSNVIIEKNASSPKWIP